ncbi:family 43 glycosylhydrolase [Paenibacillus sp. MMS18-CY102]|uniref:family 43 glycosylhydrolase n=1 Tax=Paenibacillus sp. MMS18-CY102 TaxID=2682849 RepID=UPI001365D08D|nr:family 43 glycosylhydrolase [Paenibacillus sp. MMS18-CY102]MWC29803.1 family 43 glycosylhydrolase [Paenibacillus sp. MMS18-CY102]
MRKRLLSLCLSGTMLVSTLIGFTSSSSAAEPVTTSGNPIFTSIFTADPSAHVWNDGRMYVYASHDIFPSRGSDLMDKYHVFSTDNMVDWVDEGEILSADDVPWGRPEGGFMWAPDAAYKDGTYYFYFPHPSGTNWNDSWKIGVATSNKPASDFTVQGYIQGLPGSNLIDPNVFRDDDGTYYLYAGGGGKSYGVKLAANMTSTEGPLKQFTELEDFHEATWVFKRGSMYYLMYSDNNSGGNRMRYATSSNPLGPWVNRGVILDPVIGSETTHGSIVQYKGQWYMLYHNAKISSNGTLRSVCVDRLYFNSDGTIQKVIQTSEGVPAVGSRSTATEVKYYDLINASFDAYTQKTEYAMNAGNVTFGGGATRPGSNIENMHTQGSYIQLNGINGGAGGKALLTVLYASGDSGAAFKVDASGDTAGDGYFLSLPGTGGWGNYTGRTNRLIDLNPGTNNIIRLSGGMGGANVSRVIVSLIPQAAQTTEYLMNGSNVSVGGGAVKAGASIENMHIPGSYFEVAGVNGGTGGQKLLTVIYASADTLTTFKVNASGDPTGNGYSLALPGTGGWSTFTGQASRVIDLNAGTNNVIRLSGGLGGANVTRIIISSAP